MSKRDKKPEKNGEQESVSTKRLPKLFTTQPDLLFSSLNQRPQTNKKSYAPNLNVTRNKNSEEKKNEKDPKKEPNTRTTRQQARNRDNKGNKRNAQPQLIQSHGFLSEGLSGAPVNKRTGESSGGGGRSRDAGGGASEALMKPRIVKTDMRQHKIDLENEQKVLDDLLADDDDSEADEDTKTSSSDDIVPIKIRNDSNRCNMIKNEVVSSTNSDVKIKLEPFDNDFEMKYDFMDTANGHGIKIKVEPDLPILETPSTPTHRRMDELFTAPSNQLMLFQMPDSMPGSSVETNEDDKSKQPSTSSEAAITNNITKSGRHKLCTLENLEDGMIGKLIRHKSGKVKLLIGDSVFDIDTGLQGDFLQHVATIDANAQQRSANMYSLGTIKGKYNISPDWNWLFEQVDMDP